ncbi:MAG: hypothetical protein LVT47_02005 [Cyanobacteria bacterium LVE1205-1]|jgi:uncharacterized membrane protein
MTSGFVERDYTVKIGQYFREGWIVFSQYGSGFIGFLIINLIIYTVLMSVPLSGQVISGPLSAGFLIVAFKILKKRSHSFEDFFRGFESFLQLFLVTLMSGIFIFIGTLLLIIPGIYLSVAYAFAVALVLEKRLEFWDALEASRKIISKEWFSFFWLFILIGLLNFAGLLAFGVGLLVTTPWSVCILAAAYKDVVGFNLADTDQTISDSIGGSSQTAKVIRRDSDDI